jgi:hypothetical protein
MDLEESHIVCFVAVVGAGLVLGLSHRVADLRAPSRGAPTTYLFCTLYFPTILKASIPRLLALNCNCPPGASIESA